MILIDDREPSELPGQLRDRGLEVQVERLTSGDILIRDSDDHTWAFERKTTGDFLNSWWEKRLNDQLARMTLEWDHQALLYEDDMTPLKHEYKIRRHLQTLNWVVPVLFCRGRRDLLSTVVYYHKRIMAGDLRAIRVEPEIIKLSSAVATLYAALPGVGMTRAESLAEAFPEPKELVMDMLVYPDGAWAQKRGVTGIGRKTARSIEQLFLGANHE